MEKLNGNPLQDIAEPPITEETCIPSNIVKKNVRNEVTLKDVAYPAGESSHISASTFEAFETISVNFSDGVLNMKLNRPNRGNAFNMPMWSDLTEVFKTVQTTKEAKVVVLGGMGNNFSTGMDLSVFADMKVEFYTTLYSIVF